MSCWKVSRWVEQALTVGAVGVPTSFPIVIGAEWALIAAPIAAVARTLTVVWNEGANPIRTSVLPANVGGLYFIPIRVPEMTIGVTSITVENSGAEYVARIGVAVAE